MAHLVQLIETDDKRGLGHSGSPVRRVRQWFTPDGALVCERDTWLECELLERARRVKDGKSTGDDAMGFALLLLGEL